MRTPVASAPATHSKAEVFPTLGLTKVSFSRTRDIPPVSLLALAPPSSFSGGFPDTDGDAVFVFPIVEYS